MPLIYSFIVRGSTVLGEAYLSQGSQQSGLRQVGLQLLQSCPTDLVSGKFVYPVQDLCFNYWVEQGFCFLLVADGLDGRDVPYACLDSIRTEFLASYRLQGESAQSLQMQGILKPLLLSKMHYATAHPEEASAVRGLKQQINEMQQVMEQNILQMIKRGEDIDSINAKAEGMNDQAQKFNKLSKAVADKMYWQNKKWWLILIVVIILALVIVFLSICFGGHDCFS